MMVLFSGGRSLGATVFVSAGSLASNFHTNLTTASANGLALSGDFAVFPAATYKKADGVTDSVPSASATNVMLLTGTNASVANSWVAVNSGIPFGNIDIQNNDISGDYISGGTIEGNVSFSGTISTTSLTGTSAFIGGLQGTGNRNVIVTSTGQLTAAAADVAAGNDLADGKLRFLGTPVVISSSSVAASNDWTTSSNWSGVPKNSTAGLFQFVWNAPGAFGAKSSVNENHLLEVRAGYASSGSPTLTGANTGWSNGNQHWAHPNYGGSNQFYCPLSAFGTDIRFQYRIRREGHDGTGTSDQVFSAGHHLTLLGYM